MHEEGIALDDHYVTRFIQHADVFGLPRDGERDGFLSAGSKCRRKHRDPIIFNCDRYSGFLQPKNDSRRHPPRVLINAYERPDDVLMLEILLKIVGDGSCSFGLDARICRMDHGFLQMSNADDGS